MKLLRTCLILILLIIACQAGAWSLCHVAVTAPSSWSDNFNRADENPLSGGGNWASPANAAPCQIVSNQLKSTSATKDGIALWAADSPSNDQWSEIQIVSGPTLTNNDTGPCVRMQSGAAEQYYQLDIYSDHWFFMKDGQTNLGVSQPHALAANDTFRLTVIGNVLHCSINGVDTGYTVTDNTYASGSIGIYIWGLSTIIDNWQGGNY